MSKKDFEDIMIVGDFRKALNAMESYLGTKPIIQLTENKLKEWQELEKLYSDFYEMSIEDRLIYSEINKPHPSMKREV